MVKNIWYGYLLIFLAFSCSTASKNEFGFWRKPNAFKDNIRMSKEEISNYKIDTNAVYKLKANFILRKKNNLSSGYTWYQEKSDGPIQNHNMYLRFFENGKMSLFFSKAKNELGYEDFDPRNGKMGAYTKGTDTHFLVRVVERVNAVNIVTESRAIIKKDTLYLTDRYGYHGEQFLKVEVSQNFLRNRIPDW